MTNKPDQSTEKFFEFSHKMAVSKRTQLIIILATVGVILSNNRRKLLTRKKQVKRFWRRAIFQGRKLHSQYYTLYQNLRENDREFHYRYLRMSKERFDHLLSLVRDKITKKNTRMREAVTPEERLVITIRYLATGMAQQTLCYNFRIGRTTASNIVRDVCIALYEALSPIYLRPPATEAEWRSISDDFEKIWDLPHCVGALDGKHVAIDCPKKSGSSFHNFKGFFSMVLMAVCDARYNFVLFDVGQYGSGNDSGALNESDFGKTFQKYLFNYPEPEPIPGCSLEKVPFFLVGDEIFPLKDWLMRPYPGRGGLTEEQNVFNYRLSRARRVIENTFGILVDRWRIFRGPIRASTQNVEHYVLAAMALHNYLRQTDNAGYCPTGFVDSEDSTGKIKEGEWRSIVRNDAFTPLKKRHNTRSAYSAKMIRECLKNYLNGAGAVSWQLKHVRSTGTDSESDETNCQSKNFVHILWCLINLNPPAFQFVEIIKRK